MSDEFDFLDNLPPEDAPPESASNDPPTQIDGPTCEECGVEIPWAGRGRKPKRCAEHKTRTTVRSGNGGSRVTRNQQRLDALKDDITKEIVFFGKSVAKVLPTFGVTAGKRAEKTAAAFVRIAADNPKLLEALEATTKIIPALDLGETAVALGLALLVDLGRISPDALLPTMFEVSETWHELNDEDDMIVPDGVVIQGAFAPAEQAVPRRFEKITP